MQPAPAARLQIEQFDPATDARQLRDCHQFLVASAAVDHPSLPPQSMQRFAAWWTRGHDGSPRQAWLAREDSGRPAGCYLLTLPDQENTTMAGCALSVAEASRRTGVGTALLEHCAAQARHAARSRLASEFSTRGKARDGSAGAAFAATVGASAGIPEAISILDVEPGLLTRLSRLRTAAGQRSRGYSLLSWPGATPDEHLDQLARVRQGMADAPRDAGVQPERWTAGRIRDLEQTAMAHGQDLYTVAARLPATDELAAVTQLSTDTDMAGWALQGITVVSPEHRGHRLGLLVKIAMLELLNASTAGVTRIVTGNADSNEHMVAINASIGFRVTDIYRSWELDLTAAGLRPA